MRPSSPVVSCGSGGLRIQIELECVACWEAFESQLFWGLCFFPPLQLRCDSLKGDSLIGTLPEKQAFTSSWGMFVGYMHPDMYFHSIANFYYTKISRG